MRVSRGASVHPCGGGEAEHGDGPSVAVVDDVAHLGSDQGCVSQIVVAGDELVPQLSLLGAADDASMWSDGALVPPGNVTVIRVMVVSG